MTEDVYTWLAMNANIISFKKEFLMCVLGGELESDSPWQLFLSYLFSARKP